MQKYLKLMKLLTQEFNQVEFTQIPRRRVGETVIVRRRIDK